MLQLSHFPIARPALVLLAVGLAALAGVVPAAAKNKAPLGYQLLCLEKPSECHGGGGSVAKATDATLKLLQKVNRSVNEAIAPRSDGLSDHWQAGATSGDCEDYVLAKRRALIKAGLPSSALRIAHVQTSSGEEHAVLVVKTTEGDFVLDNLNGQVRGLAQIGYRIVSMSGANPREWS